jgi:uncharacterized protein
VSAVAGRAVKRPLAEAIATTAAVTTLAGVCAHTLPDKVVATTIGFLFLGATGLLVWRKDDATVERFGLALGGLVLPQSPWSRALRDGAYAAAWAAGGAAVVAAPYIFGFRAYWQVARFDWAAIAGPGQGVDFLSRLAGQILMIGLPEEAFYRGYLQTRLDDAWPRRVQIFGAPIGVSLVVTSMLFAIGHIVTIPSPQRLAVFFPSLLFGWLRARTKGVGAGILFHAFCNLLSAALGRGFGLYG